MSAPTSIAVRSRTDHVTEVLSALFPAPYGLDPAAGRAVAGYRMVPNRRTPRLLVPQSPSLAAAGLRIAAGRGRAARFGASVSSAIPVLTGLLPLLRVYGPTSVDGSPDASARTFADHAATLLGQERVHLVIHIGGPVRANRKPVTALLDPDGQSLGYAKLGTTPLTRALVRNECAALRSLASAGLTYTRVPAMLTSDVWYDHDVLVQSALDVTEPSRRDPDLLLRAMREVAVACGVRRGPLGDSGYWAALRGRVGHRYDARLSAAVDRLATQAGDVELAYGAWHGDWTPWNCHVTAEAVQVWDWERFSVGVPLGYDLLHHTLARALARRRPSEVHHVFADPPALLAEFGLTAQQARVTTSLYLIEIATRYLSDGQRTTAAADVMTLLERTHT